MPRYYCDYCNTYLTHDSPSVRKQHDAGYKHKANVRNYYQQFEEQQTQNLIDQRIKEHLGLQQQVGATFNQQLMMVPGAPQRPCLPVMPPMKPIGAAPQVPVPSSLLPGARPPVLPPPIVAAPGHIVASTALRVPPSANAQPAAISSVAQMNILPRSTVMASPTSGLFPLPTSYGAMPPSSN